MATYKEIQHAVKQAHGFVPKTCWIAHILSDHGLTTRQSPNRINAGSRKYPCPVDKREAIEKTMRALKTI